MCVLRKEQLPSRKAERKFVLKKKKVCGVKVEEVRAISIIIQFFYALIYGLDY